MNIHLLNEISLEKLNEILVCASTALQGELTLVKFDFEGCATECLIDLSRSPQVSSYVTTVRDHFD